jgi:hypothetical protein
MIASGIIRDAQKLYHSFPGSLVSLVHAVFGIRGAWRADAWKKPGNFVDKGVKFSSHQGEEF